MTIFDFHYVMTAKNSVVSNFIVISMFLNESSSKLVQEVKLRGLFIFLAQKDNFLHYFSLIIDPIITYWYSALFILHLTLASPLILNNVQTVTKVTDDGEDTVCVQKA